MLISNANYQVSNKPKSTLQYQEQIETLTFSQ